MFGRKKKKTARSITQFSELDVGDLIVFKPREILPVGINDETLTVEKVGTYDHNGSLTSDFTLTHSSGERFSAVYNEEEDTVTLGQKISRQEVLSIFDENEFADVFDEGGSVTLNSILESVTDKRRAWVADTYDRTVAAGVAYYYDDDRRKSGVSQFEDDSLPFTYFELEGSNQHNSLSIEIWDDGETDVFCEVTVKANVVETFLCHDSE